MSKLGMNRITVDSGETNLRLKAASYVDTRILHAILNHQHDAGADWLGELEAAMSKLGMNRITVDSGETNLRLKAASYVDTRILHAFLDHQHDADANWLGEFETEITQ